MKLRVKFTKKESSRYLSHLELMTAMERTFRRAQVPFAFSQGFNPHPKISYASALTVGITSEAEYLDVELSENIQPEKFVAMANNKTIVGVEILEAVEVTSKVKSLTAAVEGASYRVISSLETMIDSEQCNETIDNFLLQPEIIVTRKTKKGPKDIDIKSGIFNMECNLSQEVLTLKFFVRSGSKGNVRPQEVWEAFAKFANINIQSIPSYVREDLYTIIDEKIYNLIDMLEG